MKYMWHWNFASNTSPLLPSPRMLQVFGTLLLTSHHCCHFTPERWSLLYPQKSFMEEKELLYSFATLWRCLVTNTFWQRWSTWSRGVIIQETVADLPQRVSDKGFRRGFLVTICLNLQRPQRPRLPKYFYGGECETQQLCSSKADTAYPSHENKTVLRNTLSHVLHCPVKRPFFPN